MESRTVQWFIAQTVAAEQLRVKPAARAHRQWLSPVNGVVCRKFIKEETRNDLMKNFCSNATVSLVIAKNMNKLTAPKAKNWDDFAEGKL